MATKQAHSTLISLVCKGWEKKERKKDKKGERKEKGDKAKGEERKGNWAKAKRRHWVRGGEMA